MYVNNNQKKRLSTSICLKTYTLDIEAKIIGNVFDRFFYKTRSVWIKGPYEIRKNFHELTKTFECLLGEKSE